MMSSYIIYDMSFQAHFAIIAITFFWYVESIT